MKKLLDTYGALGLLKLLFFKINTFFIFSNARIIRLPFRLRGKKYIQIDKGLTTGYNCRFDAFDFNELGKKLIIIGKDVEINDDVHIAAVENVQIGNNVLIASKVYISDHDHGSYKGEIQDSPLSKPSDRKIYSSPVIIEDRVWLGEYVCILKGVKIGEGSIIGAMSVVTKDIPAYCIAIGSPAKVVKKFDFDKKEWIQVK